MIRKAFYWFQFLILAGTLFAALPSHGQSTNNPALATNAVATTVVVEKKEKNPPPVVVTFRLDRIEALQKEYAGIPLWQYIASVIFVVLAFYISKILDWIIQAWLKSWAKKTSTRLDDFLLELLHGPIKVVSFVIFLHIGLEVFAWPSWAENIFQKILGLVVAISVTYMLTKLVDMGMGIWADRTKVDPTQNRMLHQQLFPVIRKTMKVVIIIVAFLFTAENVFQKDITALIAFGSIGGLALGLAGQDTLANLFGAVAVFVDRPFQIGDTIHIDATTQGVVESIGLRSTRVRNPDGHLITVPNKTMGNATITNVTLRPNIKTTMNFGLTYDTPVEKVRRAVQILEEIYKGHPMTGDLMISFNKFEVSSLNIMVVHFWKNTDHKAYLQGIQEMNLAIKGRFEREEIQMAFPTQTIHFKTEEKQPAPARYAVT